MPAGPALAALRAACIFTRQRSKAWAVRLVDRERFAAAPPLVTRRDGRLCMARTSCEGEPIVHPPAANWSELRLGLPMESIRFNYGASTLPGVIMAGGSQQTAATGASVLAAYNKLAADR